MATNYLPDGDVLLSTPHLLLARNKALDTNPPVADNNITSHGSSWLWAVAALHAFLFLVVLALTMKTRHRQRVFHYIALALLMVPTIAYFTMAGDLGGTPIQTQFRQNGLPGRTRQIFWVRFVGKCASFDFLSLPSLGLVSANKESWGNRMDDYLVPNITRPPPHDSGRLVDSHLHHRPIHPLRGHAPLRRTHLYKLQMGLFRLCPYRILPSLLPIPARSPPLGSPIRDLQTIPPLRGIHHLLLGALPHLLGTQRRRERHLERRRMCLLRCAGYFFERVGGVGTGLDGEET